MIKYTLNDCSNLTLYSSESCNLSCNYCFMASTADAARHAKEALKTKMAFEDGTYLNNIKIAFERLNIDKNNITHVDLWGQEPTLTLNEVVTFWPEFTKLCPNVNDFFFSTNGVAYFDRIIKMISVAFENAPRDKKFHFGLQFSYDGQENTRKQRGANPDTILNNIRATIKELNKLTFSKDFEISINFHNVLDDTLITKFSDTSTEEKKKELYAYLKEFQDITDEMKELSTNPSVRIDGFGVGLIYPYNATVEDGKNLTKFYKNCDAVGNDLHEKVWKGLSHLFYRAYIKAPYEQQCLPFLQKIADDDPVDAKVLRSLSMMLTCAYNVHSLKIRYDGTLAHCQNGILLGMNLEDLEGKNGLDYEVQRQRLKHHWYPNVVTDSDEILDNYLYQSKLMADEQFAVTLAQTINVLLELSHAGQIDPDYSKNKEKLLRHAFVVSMSMGCPHNNLIETGSPIGRSAGWARFVCNGFLDLADNEYEFNKENNISFEPSQTGKENCIYEPR